MECVGNLGPRARVAYLRAGLLAFAFAVTAGVAAVTYAAPLALRLLLVAPFAVAWGCLLDAVASTCGFRAAQGLRVSDRGLEPIANPRELRELRKRAKNLACRVALATLVTVAPFLVMGRP